MKKVLYGLVFTLVLTLAGFRANAQVSYVGGSFGLSASDGHGVDHSGTVLNGQNMFDFSVAPDFGWDLKDNLAVGVRPTLGFGRVTTGSQGIRSFSLGVNPYGRYRVLDIRRFGLWAEADADLSFSQNRNLDGRVIISTVHTTGWEIQLLPVLTYRLSGHVSLETRLNIFSFGLAGAHVVNDGVSDYHSTSFRLKASSEDIVGDLGDITIGFLYRF